MVLSNEEIVRWFLDRGCDPNGKCSGGITAVVEAARVASLSVLKLLLAYHGTARNSDAIARAVHGHILNVPDRLEVVECLLAAGAPIDAYQFEPLSEEVISMAQLIGMETGLQLAVRENKLDMVKLLVQRGADVMKKGGLGTRGENAIEIAESKGFGEIVTLLRSQSSATVV